MVVVAQRCRASVVVIKCVTKLVKTAMVSLLRVLGHPVSLYYVLVPLVGIAGLDVGAVRK
jgi:hypothetical protein